MQLHDALDQIAEIRTRMTAAQTFRGYRSATTAFSAIIALATTLLQSLFPITPKSFTLLWTTAAALCLLVMAVELLLRSHRSSTLQKQLTVRAAEQFAPAVGAGALFTFAIYNFLPQQLPLLPALWMLLFSLGLFASARLLPREVFAVAAFYLLAALLTLLLTPSRPFSPWLMGIPFTLGQSALAAILYFRLEKNHD